MALGWRKVSGSGRELKVFKFLCVYFLKTTKNKKKYIKARLDKTYPQFKTGGYFFRQYLNKYINIETIVLDAGCGDGGMISDLKLRPKLIIGIDKSEKLLNNNKIIDQKIISDLEKVPLTDNSVDIVSSEFVLEHIIGPELIFREIHRVLKPGGAFIFITPNIINPIMFLSKILPHFFHEFFRKIILGKNEETHPTYYLANTYNKLIKIGGNAGFNKLEISRAGNPEYLGFCKIMVNPSILMEKMIDNKFLDIFKMYLVGCFIKE